MKSFRRLSGNKTKKEEPRCDSSFYIFHIGSFVGKFLAVHQFRGDFPLIVYTEGIDD